MSREGWKITTVILLAAVAGACSSSEDRQVEHPQTDYILESSLPRNTVDRSARGAQVFSPTALGDSIGVASGDPAETVGRIADVAALSDRSTMILDGFSSQVAVYNELGQHSQAFGGIGQGPGEFLRAKAMAIVRDGEIVVADEALRLHVFRLDESEWAHDRTIALSGSPQDLCRLDDVLFLSFHSDVHKSSLLQMSSTAYDDVREIATYYDHPNPLVRHAVSEALVACDSDGESGFVMSRRVGEILAIDVSGRVKWATRLSEFKGPGVLPR